MKRKYIIYKHYLIPERKTLCRVGSAIMKDYFDTALNHYWEKEGVLVTSNFLFNEDYRFGIDGHIEVSQELLNTLREQEKYFQKDNQK